MKQFLNFINGEFVATAKTFEKRAPATNAVIGQVHEAGQAEVDAAVAAGRALGGGNDGRGTGTHGPGLNHQNSNSCLN